MLAWVLGWLALGTVLALEVARLTELSDTAVAAGRALDTTADALHAIEEIPFVGTSFDPLERRLREAGARARAGGAESRTAIRRASILVWIAVVAGPIAPILFLYAPRRLAWSRERAIVRDVLGRRGLDRELRAYLVRRALARPLPELVTAGGREKLDRAALARLELARLGLREPAADPRP